jgi:hypothetical protein
MSAKYVYESSKVQEVDQNYYKQRQYVWTNDINQSNYSSNQLQYDLTTLYNESSLIDWANNVELICPVVTVLSVPTIQDPTKNNYALTYKNGYHNIINSVYMESDGQTIHQASQNTNYYVSFKKNTSLNMNDIKTRGALNGIYPDNFNSWKYINTSVANNASITGLDCGSGSVNNVIYRDFNDLANNPAYNEGAYFRAQKTGGFTANNNGTNNNNLGAKYLNNSINELQDYVQYDPVGTVAAGPNQIGTQKTQNIIFYTTMVIKLGDISDFVKNLPLCRLYMRLTITLNMGSFNFQYKSLAGSNQATIMGVTGSSFPFNTNPIMISKLNTDVNNLNGGLNLVTNGQGTIESGKVSIQIAKNNINLSNTMYSHQLNSTRVYAPVINLEPELEKEYLMNNLDRTIRWRDIYSTQLSNIQPSAQFNYVVTNGLSGIKSVLVIPFVSEVVNDVNAMSVANGVGLGLSPALSPFASEPSTTSPLLQISQFNLLLAGRQVLNQNMIFGFEQFMQNLYGCNAINGGATEGLNSGLIGFNEFLNNYKYYYVNCEYQNSSDIGPKSVAIQGINNNLVAISLYIFVEYEKECELNIETGKIKVR